MLRYVLDICAGPVCGTPGQWAAGGGGAAGGAIVLVAWWAWLKWLRWLPAWGLFTRLRSDRLLEHPMRARLHAMIEAEPGLHHQALVDATGMGKGQAAHHLATLVRAGLLTVVKRRGFALYFVRGSIDAPVMHSMSAVKSATAVRALRLIAERPGAGKRPLARDVGCSEGSLRHHLRRFEEAGLVEDEDGLRLSPLGEQVLAMLPDVGRPQRPPGMAV